jgi:hypothetical protein
MVFRENSRYVFYERESVGRQPKEVKSAFFLVFNFKNAAAAGAALYTAQPYTFIMQAKVCTAKQRTFVFYLLYLKKK